jgi:hypothetical protein
MPSNHYTHVCIPCRNVIGWGLCPECGGERVTVARWSAPKKNNDRAWKRIEKGEWLWDRRRVVRSKRTNGRIRDTFTRWETRKIEIPHECVDEYCSWHHQVNGLVRIERIPGSKHEVINNNRLPDVDMGG